MKLPIALVIVQSILITTPVASESGCDEPPVAITGARLFDGASVFSSATVITRCTTIWRIIHGDELPVLPEESLIIEGKGRTLLPGLIDTHTHTWSLPMLQRPLDFGVTSVMDMGSTNLEFAGSIKADRASGPARDRADLFSAVLWVTAPGSHGTQFGEVPTLIEPEDAADFVAARVAEGADFIKLIYDNFKMFDQEIPTLKKETMEAAVAAAHARGKIVVVHSRDVQAYADVANAGVDGIVHLPVDEVPGAELIALLKEKGIWVSANLSLNQPVGDSVINDPALGPMLTESEKQNLQNFRLMHREGGDQVALDTLAALHAAGIMILTGSDTPNGGTTQGATMHMDIALLVENGFTPVEALRSATADAATAFGLEDRGRIAEGLQADLLLVEGHPDENIEDTRNIVAVIKAGNVHFHRPTAMSAN